MPPTTQLNNLFGCLFIFLYFYFSVRVGAFKLSLFHCCRGSSKLSRVVCPGEALKWIVIRSRVNMLLTYVPDAPAFSCSMCRESFLLFCDFDVTSYCGWGSGHNNLDSRKLWHSLGLQGCLVPLMTEAKVTDIWLFQCNGISFSQWPCKQVCWSGIFCLFVHLWTLQ